VPELGLLRPFEADFRMAMICIYCSQSDDGQFRGKEHVIPRAFGRFNNNFTLRCVCDPCNAYFSRELELALGRGSAEAVLRLHHGLKPVEEATDLDPSRVRIRISQRGPAEGALATFRPHPVTGTLESVVLPQAGFRRKGTTDWVWFTEERLGDRDALEPYRTGVEIKILAPDEASRQSLMRKIQQAGVTIREEGPIHEEAPVTETKLHVRSELDEKIRRAYAKIGLNYLAHCEGVEFALRPEFNAVRDFVRLERKPTYDPVIATNRAILADDSPRWRGTEGHLVTMCWANGCRDLICCVSLFNRMTFDVYLCRNYEGVWRDIKRGHHFNIQTRTISKIKLVSTALL
jgi:hypothetical protein